MADFLLRPLEPVDRIAAIVDDHSIDVIDPPPVWSRASVHLARWGIAPHNDDDAFTPDHVEVLLREARRRELEFVYGRIRHLLPGGEEVLHGVFPPALHEFGVQASLVHRGLRFLSWELMDAAFGVPGDWSWVRRMMRIGVRIGMVADNVVDYYPAKRWNEGPG